MNFFFYLQYIAPCDGNKIYRVSLPKFQPEITGSVYLKPWLNGLASRRKLKTWVYLLLRLTRPCVHLRWLAMTCVHFGRDQICTQVKASFLTSTGKSQTHFKADISYISLANDRLMGVTQLALTWLGWPNGEKLALTWVQIWSRPKWTQVIASQRKCTQGLVKRSHK